MKILHITTAFTLSSMAALSLQAAPSAWTSATTTGADPMTGSSTLTSFTTADWEFSSFTYPVSGTYISGGAVNGSGVLLYTDGARNFWSETSTEEDGIEAVFDGRLDSGVLAHGVFDYEFAGPISIDDYIFCAELGGGDNITIKPLDASGNLIGSYSLAMDTDDWGATVGLAANWKLDSGTGGEPNENTNGNPQVLRGITFQLSDFGDTLLLDGTVYGLRIDGATTFDPAALGTATNPVPVPEPSTVGLIGLGLLACGTTCRRKA